jgi:hypothetical protein
VLFAFVQFEFTHAIGPHAGRYVVANARLLDANGAAPRADDLPRKKALAGATMSPGTADVLAITVVGAPTSRRRLLRRRPTPAEQEAGGVEVPVLLATFIRGTEPLAAPEAAAMLQRIAASEELQEAIVADGLRALNDAIVAYRAGARDPYVTEVARRDARAVRIGYGDDEQVAEGRWSDAIVLPPELGRKPSREERLAPSEVTAKVLSGRGDVLDGETVLLRAYADLDHHRDRAAALQLRAAVELLEAELGERGAIAATRLDFAALAADAAAASAPEQLEDVIAKLERGIERWRFELP